MDREKQDWQEWERNLDGFTQRVDNLIKKSGKTKADRCGAGHDGIRIIQMEACGPQRNVSIHSLADGEGSGHISGLSPFWEVSDLKAPPSSSGP